MFAKSGLFGVIGLIAPCGLNCGLCRSFVRNKNPCPGCRVGDSNKSNACLTCVIKHCGDLAAGGHQFCFSCTKFPCTKLLHLDDRYQMKYGISVITNLARIKAIGVESFIAEDDTKWLCPRCGSRLCIHKPRCVSCGHKGA